MDGDLAGKGDSLVRDGMQIVRYIPESNHRQQIDLNFMCEKTEFFT